MTDQRWPQSLWEAGHLDSIDIPARGMDVGLSDCGEEQAAALGKRLRRTGESERPDVVLCSLYGRAE